MYREQEYVDRCYCDAPGTAHCAMCNRARCAKHVERDGRCHRCEEAVGHEMAGRAGTRFAWSAAVGAAGALGSLVAHAVVLSIPLAGAGAAATFFGLRAWQRRSAARRLAPKLAASTGEVAPGVDYDAQRFPDARETWRTLH
jgi:hypothetical protein